MGANRGRGIALKDMAAGLHCTPAYLSAMEHGHRGNHELIFIHEGSGEVEIEGELVPGTFVQIPFRREDR